MTAYEIYINTCDMDFTDYTETLNQDLKAIEKIKDLFLVMRCDLGVMAEYGDNERELLEELINAPADIIKEYRETFL